MVLERSVLLLQQEEEEFGPEKGIHQETHNGNKKHCVKHGNKTEDKRRGYSFGRLFCHNDPESGSQARGDTEFNKREALIIQHGTQETQEQQGWHSITDKH